MHVVQYAANATHFFAATGPSGSTVHEVSQRGAMPRRLGGAMTINNDHAAVIRGRSEHQFSCNIIVVGHYGTREATFAESCKFNGFIK